MIRAPEAQSPVGVLMAAKGKFLQRFGTRAAIGAAAACGLALMSAPSLAQFGARGGTFDSFFGPWGGQRPPERPVDYSRAPAPRKLETQPSGGTVLVLGDSMADWLAYGLEDALGDPPDFSVVRKNRATSGLIRYDSRNESQDWAQVIRETIAATKPNFIVMMVGLNDRGDIRERVSAPAKGGAAATKEKEPAAQPSEAAKSDNQDAEQSPGEQAAPAPPTAAPERPQRGGVTTTTYKLYDFHTDEWAALYTKRIDATIAALKSAGVPVFWVGLPSIRGPKSTADVQYLNELYKARVEKASANYIDVWDGFVDETGRFNVQGPDFEGQTRRLRTGDGVHFTKAGARKLAHYLEREIRRVMTPGAEVVALPPSDPQVPSAPGKAGGPAARPLAGPVVPLTVSVTSGQELLGPRDAGDPSTPKSVTRVLVNGEAIAPPAGRADDFKWPRRVIAPVGTDPVVATTTEPIPVMKPAPETTVAAPNSDVRPVGVPNPGPRKPAATATTNTARAPWQQPNRGGFFSFFR